MTKIVATEAGAVEVQREVMNISGPSFAQPTITRLSVLTFYTKAISIIHFYRGRRSGLAVMFAVGVFATD